MHDIKAIKHTLHATMTRSKASKPSKLWLNKIYEHRSWSGTSILVATDYVWWPHSFQLFKFKAGRK